MEIVRYIVACLARSAASAAPHTLSFRGVAEKSTQANLTRYFAKKETGLFEAIAKPSGLCRFLGYASKGQEKGQRG